MSLALSVSGGATVGILDEDAAEVLIRMGARSWGSLRGAGVATIGSVDDEEVEIRARFASGSGSASRIILTGVPIPFPFPLPAPPRPFPSPVGT